MAGPPTTPPPKPGEGGRQRMPELMWLAIAAGAWIWIGGISWLVISSDDEDKAIEVAQRDDKDEDEADDDEIAEAEAAREAARRAAVARAAEQEAVRRRVAETEARVKAEEERAAAKALALRTAKQLKAKPKEIGETKAQRERRESEAVNKLLADLAAAKGKGGKEDVDPKAGLPQTLNAGILASTFRKRQRKFTACYRKEQAEPLDEPMPVQVSLVISSNGQVSTAKVLSGSVSGATKGCLVTALMGTRFPEFRELSQAVKYPIMLR